MKNTVTAVVALLVGVLPAAAQKKPVTIDDVLNLKAVASAVVSPDGTQVLYTVRQWEADKERMESRTRIWKVPAAGGPARQITFGERGDSQPQFSPDGAYISFVSARGAAIGEETPRPQIYVMRAAGGEAWKLTDAKEGIVQGAYAWSPDSRRIAYVSVDARPADQDAAIKKRDDERVFESDFRYSHIWTIDLESKQTARVTDGSSWTVRGTPSWAPDSKRIAFAANVTGMLRDYRTDVYIADISSKQIDKISTNPATDAQPEWSPDGAVIAFISEPAMGKELPDGTWPSSVGNSHLMLYDVAKKTIKDASSKDFDLEAGAPRWTADSKRIVFTSGKRTYTEIFRYDVATGAYEQVTSKPRSNLDPGARTAASP